MTQLSACSGNIGAAGSAVGQHGGAKIVRSIHKEKNRANYVMKSVSEFWVLSVASEASKASFCLLCLLSLFYEF